jgi:hypothetical protein
MHIRVYGGLGVGSREEQSTPIFKFSIALLYYEGKVKLQSGSRSFLSEKRFVIFKSQVVF